MTSKINHSGDGETVSFSFPFFIPAKTALEVRVGGAIRAEGFNIVGAACPEGGKVVFDAPPASGEQVSLRYRGGVSATVDDSTFGHLADKLVAGANVTVETKTLDGGVQQVCIAAAASDLSKSVADGLYLAKSANLSDVPSKETARDNLGVTTAIANAVAPLNTSVNSLGNTVTSLNGTVAGLSAGALMKAENLLDVPNKETARANLGVTAAISAVETSLNNAVTALGNSMLVALPAGMTGAFRGSVPPSGWLKENGAAVSVAAYPALAAAIYCGDANNAFAAWGYRCTNPASPDTSRSLTGGYIVLADARGEFARGWDDGRGVDPGRTLWSAQADEVRSHSHGVVQVINGSGGLQMVTASGSSTLSSITGAYGGAETRGRNLAYLPVIKY